MLTWGRESIKDHTTAVLKIANVSPDKISWQHYGSRIKMLDWASGACIWGTCLGTREERLRRERTLNDPENFSSPTESAISLVEEYGRKQRVANFPVARDPTRIGRKRHWSCNFAERVAVHRPSVRCAAARLARSFRMRRRSGRTPHSTRSPCPLTRPQSAGLSLTAVLRSS